MGLVGPDEPRYVWIARAMATTGDWVTPRLYGQPWFEKPALYYWAAAIGFRMHLPAEWAARLPSALAALATAIAIGWLARKFYGHDGTFERNTALLAPLLFSASVGAIGFARAATPDMLFSAAIALAMASAASVLQQSRALGAIGEIGAASSAAVAAEGVTEAKAGAPKRSLGSLLWFGVFLGLGVLAKGPAAVILATGAVGLWAVATRQRRAAFRLAHPPAIVALCAVALPWYVLCALRNPNFLHVFIFQHNFKRYLTPVFQHRQPFWFFVPITIAAILPWVALLWPAAKEGLWIWRNGNWKESPGLFFACWALFPILFFSASQSKLPSYILPSVAPLILLLAAAWTRQQDNASGSATRAARRLGAGMSVTWIALGVATLMWRSRLPATMREDLGLPIVVSAITVLAGGAWILSRIVAGKRVSVKSSLLLVVLLAEFAGWRTLPALDPYISARWHGEFVRNDAHPDRIFIYRLPRSWEYGLAFYVGRELPEWTPTNPESALVLTTAQGLAEMKKLGRVQGVLDESYKGIVYVPAFPAPF